MVGDEHSFKFMRLRGERNSAREETGALQEEHNLVLVDLERVRKERDDTLRQIEPLLKQVEELKLERETSVTLGREWQAMMLELVQRARRSYSRLSGENIDLHGEFQPEAPASHVFFYLSLVELLEKVVGEVDAVVEGECRDLLAQAGKMIFTNLCLLCNSGALGQAGLRFDAVLEPTPADDAECTEALQEEVDELVDVLCVRF